MVMSAITIRVQYPSPVKYKWFKFLHVFSNENLKLLKEQSGWLHYTAIMILVTIYVLTN
jgi:hypothetical protein